MAPGHRRHHAGVRRPGDVRRDRHPLLRPVQPGVRVPGAAHRDAAVRRDEHEPAAHAAPEPAAEPRPLARRATGRPSPGAGEEAGGPLAERVVVRLRAAQRLGVGAVSFPMPRSNPDLVVDAMPSTPPVAPSRPSRPDREASRTTRRSVGRRATGASRARRADRSSRPPRRSRPAPARSGPRW